MITIADSLAKLLETPLLRITELSIGQALVLALLCGVLSFLFRK
jgi:hypothetical protein